MGKTEEGIRRQPNRKSKLTQLKYTESTETADREVEEDIEEVRKRKSE